MNGFAQEEKYLFPFLNEENSVSFDDYWRGFLGAGALRDTTSPGTSSSEDILTQLPARSANLKTNWKYWQRKTAGKLWRFEG